VEQPGEGKSFAGKEIKIRSCPTRDYLGLVSPYLGQGDAPPFVNIRTLKGQALKVGTGRGLEEANVFLT